MKKRFLLILIMLIINTAIFAKDFGGILGLKLNMSPEDACKVMLDQGWTIDYKTSDYCTFKKKRCKI